MPDPIIPDITQKFADKIVIESYPTFGITFGFTEDLKPIFTEFGRVAPEPKIEPTNALGLTIINSKKFDFLMSSNLLPNHLIRIDINEADAIGGVQVLRKTLFATAANVEFSYKAINDVVFISLTNINISPNTLSGEIKIVSELI